MKVQNSALVGCGILLLCQVGAADERVARLDLDELEKAYWTCYQEAAEMVVAQHRLDQIAMQVCGGRVLLHDGRPHFCVFESGWGTKPAAGSCHQRHEEGRAPS